MSNISALETFFKPYALELEKVQEERKQYEHRIRQICAKEGHVGYGYYGLFKPSIGEVLSQINEYDIPLIKAFEIIESPETVADFHKDSFTSIAFDNGYHVSTVRLYGEKR